jgi:hypothetical protein
MHPKEAVGITLLDLRLFAPPWPRQRLQIGPMGGLRFKLDAFADYRMAIPSTSQTIDPLHGEGIRPARHSRQLRGAWPNPHPARQ